MPEKIPSAYPEYPLLYELYSPCLGSSMRYKESKLITELPDDLYKWFDTFAETWAQDWALQAFVWHDDEREFTLQIFNDWIQAVGIGQQLLDMGVIRRIFWGTAVCNKRSTQTMNRADLQGFAPVAPAQGRETFDPTDPVSKNFLSGKMDSDAYISSTTAQAAEYFKKLIGIYHGTRPWPRTDELVNEPNHPLGERPSASGLMQTTSSTWDSSKSDPIGDVFAAMKYIQDRYPSPQPRGKDDDGS